VKGYRYVGKSKLAEKDEEYLPHAHKLQSDPVGIRRECTEKLGVPSAVLHAVTRLIQLYDPANAEGMLLQGLTRTPDSTRPRRNNSTS